MRVAIVLLIILCLFIITVFITIRASDGLSKFLGLRGKAEPKDVSRNVSNSLSSADLRSGLSTRDEPPRLSNLSPEELVEALKGLGPDVWHQVAIGYNWNYQPEVVFGWIVNQENCELSTAITILTMGQAVDLMREEASGSDISDDFRFEMFETISQRINDGDYQINIIDIGDPVFFEELVEFQRTEEGEGRKIRWALPHEVIELFEASM